MLGWTVPVCEAAHVTKLVNPWVEIRGTGLCSSSLHGLYWLLKENVRYMQLFLHLKMDLKENRKAVCLT